MATQQFVVRLAPITGQALLVRADSLRDGQLQAIIGEETKTIGVDFFRASAPVTRDIAHKIVQEYAKKQGIDEHTILVRERLPKTNVKARHTNDAHLTVVPNLARRKEDAQQGDELKNAVQAMQDGHDNEKKASVGNPEGATVKRSEQEKKPRRKYTKQDKERSARSKAAYERYVKEISQHIEASPTAMQPAVSGPGVSQEDVDEATLQFALKLAKLLKGVM